MSAHISTEFFVASAAGEVRRMPVADARLYLRGLLLLVGECAGVEPLREIYRQLDGADAQLELIAEGQMRLKLGGGGQ